MSRTALLGLLLLAGCSGLPRPRPAPSGITATGGGGELALHNEPRGVSNFPYK